MAYRRSRRRRGLRGGRRRMIFRGRRRGMRRRGRSIRSYSISRGGIRL